MLGVFFQSVYISVAASLGVLAKVAATEMFESNKSLPKWGEKGYDIIT